MYSLEEKTSIVQQYLTWKSYINCQRAFYEYLPDSQVSTRSTIFRIAKELEETGSALD